MIALDIKRALAVRHRSDVFLTEVQCGPRWGKGIIEDPTYGMRQFDALAIIKSWAHFNITGYEIKISRADFKRDSKWRRYLNFCNAFYFVCPKGLITQTEIKALSRSTGIGLVYVNDNLRCRTIIKPTVRIIDPPIEMFKYIIMNRVVSDLPNIQRGC